MILKKMLLLSLVTSFTVNNTIYAKSAQPQQVIVVQQPSDDDVDTTPLVLQNFGGVVMSFLSMLQNPHDTDHVIKHVGDMVSGMINVVKVGMRRFDPEMEELRKKLVNEIINFILSEEGQLYLADLSQNCNY